MNIPRTGCRFNLSPVIILLITLFSVGCSTSPPMQQTQAELHRADLYEGRAPITINKNKVPANEQQAISQAQAAHKLQKLDTALYCYIQALEFNPDNADTLYRIGRIHDFRRNNKMAIKAYLEAVALAPDMGVAHGALGVLAMNSRQYQLATVHLNQAVSLDQLRLNNTKQKIEQLEFISLDQSSPMRAYNALAVVEDLVQRHLTARIYFKLALKQQPRSPLLATNLGYSFYLSGQYNLAERYLKQAIEYSPAFERAWTNLGLVYARKGQYNQALISFEQVMSPAEALNDLGYYLLLERKYTQAIELFRRAIDSSSQYFEQANKNLKRATLGNRALVNAKAGKS